MEITVTVCIDVGKGGDGSGAADLTFVRFNRSLFPQQKKKTTNIIIELGGFKKVTDKQK